MPRIRFPGRSARLALVAGLVVSATLSGAVLRPAAANSALGLANNAWLVSELAAQGYGAIQSVPPSAEVSAYERSMVASATVGTTAAAGVRTIPKPGVLGMVVNTVGVLGGLAFALGGGDDPAPELPSVSGGGFTTQACSGAVWFTGGAGASAGCAQGTGRGYASLNSGDSLGKFWYVNGLQVWSGSQFLNRSFQASAHVVEVYTGEKLSGGQWVPSGSLVASFWLSTGWNVAGNPNPVTEPALVPRYIDSTATCMSPGGTPTVQTGRVGPFYLDPSQPMTTPQVPDLACPPGTWLKSGTRELASEGTEVKVPLQTPYEAPGWVEEQVTRFPECYPVTNVKCELKLFKVNVVPELDCHAYASGSANPCLDWRNDPNRVERYECRFGATPVALKRCAPYETLWTTGVVTPTPADPDTEVDPAVPGVDPTPEETPDLGGCVPNWSELLNPWWVYKANVCAMKWALVPKTALATRVATIRDTFQTKVPFAWFSGFASIPGAVPVGGCPDWRIKVPEGPGDVGGTLDKNVVCDSSFTDAIVAGRPVFLVFMGALALWPLLRSTAYAAFPIIKPQPGVLR